MRMFSTLSRRAAVRYLVHRMWKDGKLRVQFVQNRGFDYAVDDSVKRKDTLYWYSGSIREACQLGNWPARHGIIVDWAVQLLQNNQRTNRPVNAHLISEPRISINHKKKIIKRTGQTLTLISHNPSFNHLVYIINQIPGQRMQ